MVARGEVVVFCKPTASSFPNMYTFPLLPHALSLFRTIIFLLDLDISPSLSLSLEYHNSSRFFLCDSHEYLPQI